MREKFVQTGQADRRFRMPRGQSGFSILEMLLASAVLMVGIVSVVQLVPASLQLNANNRLDTLATVIAQRELDQMLGQPLWVDTFLDEDKNIISLGGPNSPGASVVKDYVGAEQIEQENYHRLPQNECHGSTPAAGDLGHLGAEVASRRTR